MATGDEQQMRAVKNYVTQMLGDPEETRKLLVQNIAQNIFENLKKNSEMKDMLIDLLATEERETKRSETKKLEKKTFSEFSSKREESTKVVRQFLSESSTKNEENSKTIRRTNGSERPHEKIDSGAFSEETDEGLFVYKSSCKIENKSFGGDQGSAAAAGLNFGDLEHQGNHLLPLPVAEFNNGKSNYDNSRGSRSMGIRLAGEKSDLESSSLHEELVAEKAFERLYEKLEANGELMDLSFHSMDASDHSSCAEKKQVKTGSVKPVKTTLIQPDTSRHEKPTEIHRQELHQDTFHQDTTKESLKQETGKESTGPEVKQGEHKLKPEPRKLAPLEDPSIILTSPNQITSSQHQTQLTERNSIEKIDPYLNEEIHLMQEDKARSFLQEVLTEKKQSSSFNTNHQSFQINQLSQSRSMSHFDELRAKQREEHLNFHQKLIQELGKSQTSCRPAKNPKFVSAKSADEQDPPSIHVYDPLHPTTDSPIPRRRNESESVTPKHSQSQPVSPPNGQNVNNFRSWKKTANAIPIKYNTVGRYVDDSWINKGNFWSSPNSPKTLPRARRRVTFKEEQVTPVVPERPPPPAPVRQTSYQAVNNFLVQGISFGSQKATAAAAAANNATAVLTTAYNTAAVPAKAYNTAENECQFPEYENQKSEKNISQVDGRKHATTPRASRRGKMESTEENDEDQYKVDMGEKVDHWFQLYGKAVEDNTLQDRIEAHRLQQLEQQQQQQQSWFRTQQEGKNKISYVQQLLMEEEKEKLESSRDQTVKQPQVPPENRFEFQPQNEPENTFVPIPLDALKNLVRNVLLHQGISNPSDQVLDESIQNYLQSQQVFVGSASEGVLFPGDRVVSINHQDTSRLTHLEAQNLIKNAGTSARVDVIRPGAPAPKRGSFSGMSSPGFFQPMDNQEFFEREQEMAKVHSQPFRTKQLVFPGAKSIHDKNAPVPAVAPIVKESPASHDLMFGSNLPKVAAAQTVVDAICHKQPYRTTPLVTPAPRTIGEVTANRICSSPIPFKPAPFHQQANNSPGGQAMKTVNIGGTPKQLVNNQFNSPIGLYSEDAIAEAVVTNPSIVQANCPTLGQLQQHQYQYQHPQQQQQQHPGYVQSSKPHLPHPKDATFSRPQASETFKIILESEMDKARDQKGVTGHEFTKQAHFDRPSSSASNKAVDPCMMDKSINQSASFKRIMYSVLDADEY